MDKVIEDVMKQIAKIYEERKVLMEDLTQKLVDKAKEELLKELRAKEKQKGS